MMEKKHKIPRSPKVTSAADLPPVVVPTPRTLPGWRFDVVALLLLAIVIGLLYGHTLHVPWYMDDAGSILENRYVSDLRLAVAGLVRPRGLGVFSFALNHAVHGYDLPGYHLVNIFIHLCTSWLAYLVAKRIFRDSWLWPVLTALVFAVHPLQTQAVTYVVQRLACLAALFFLLACYLFCRFREHGGGNDRQSAASLLFYAGALLAGLLAVTTKQNTAVLPGALLLLDLFFLDQGSGAPRRLWHFAWLLPFFLAPLAMLLIQVVAPMTAQVEMQKIASYRGDPITPLQYLFTEFSVIWLYIRLLFFPYPQMLEYGMPVSADLLTFQSVGSLIALLALAGLAFRFRKRYPFVTFGVFWFLLCLAVESSLIPLDTVFEHRLYLPLFGFAVVLAGSLRAMLPERYSTGLLLILLCGLGVVTWQRNNLWNDPVAFFEDNARHAYNPAFALRHLGDIWRDRGEYERSLHYYESSLRYNPKNKHLLKIIGFNLLSQGKFDAAESNFQAYLAAGLSSPDVFRTYPQNKGCG